MLFSVTISITGAFGLNMMRHHWNVACMSLKMGEEDNARGSLSALEVEVDAN
jgi:hypothetical protein